MTVELEPSTIMLVRRKIMKIVYAVLEQIQKLTEHYVIYNILV